MQGGDGTTLCPSASHCEGVFPWMERAGIRARPAMSACNGNAGSVDEAVGGHKDFDEEDGE